MPGPIRDLKHEERYDASAVRIFGTAQEAEDQLSAVTFALAKEWDFSRYVSAGNWQGHPLQVLPIEAHGERPPVWVFFSLNPHTEEVHLVDVMV